MPAAIEEDNTFRLWINYNDGFYDHSLQFRYAGDVTTETEVMTVGANYLAALDPIAYLITVGTVEFAGESTNVRNPVVWLGDPTYGSGAQPEVNAPRYIMFTGKDQTGHRWHLTQFGLNFSTPSKYRFLLGGLTEAEDARNVLETAFSTSVIQSINKRAVRTNGTIPVGFNDHFVVQARG